MLLQFRVKNYCSIGDEITLDLTAGKGREHKDFVIEKNGIGILPVISMYGGNAGGKSNIINAIYSMFNNIAISHTYGQNDQFAATPFLYNEELSDEPTECEIFFGLGIHEYQYGYKATSEKVYEEWLYYRKMSSKDTVVKTVFERSDDTIQFSGVYKSFERYNDLINENSLILSVLGNRKLKQPSKNEKVFISIVEWTTRNIAFSVIHMFENDALYEIYYKNDVLKNSALEFLQEFDSSIEDIEVLAEKNEKGKPMYEVFTKHREKMFPIHVESTGTRKLFNLHAAIATALQKQSLTLIYDELDNYLHPLILRRIVSMFHNKELNIMNSQLIFTSHNLTLLNRKELRRDEIWFVEKDENEYTTTYSLDSFKSTKDEVRADLDYGKHYLSGRFGAIPYAKKLVGGNEWVAKEKACFTSEKQHEKSATKKLESSVQFSG